MILLLLLFIEHHKNGLNFHMECNFKDVGIYYGHGQNHKSILINFLSFKKLTIMLIVSNWQEKIY
jgi:hypothetical protein